MMLNSGNVEQSPWEEFLSEVATELDQTNRSIKETAMMISQTQIDINKLSQRNQVLTAQIQQLQSTFESVSKSEMKQLYDSALDTQQRLERMRGQVEKLQSDQAALTRYKSLIDKMRHASDSGTSASSVKKGSAAETVQMLINAQEVERQRLSRQMHDGPAQALSNFILQTEIAMKLFDVDQLRAKDELTNLKNSALTTFQKVRNFIFELRPMMLDDLGLVPTIKRYKETFAEQSGLDVDLVVGGQETRLASYLEVMVFRSIQELLGNAYRLSLASKVKVTLNIDNDYVRVSVEDNGKGFPIQELQSDANLGVKLIRDRVDMLGGRTDIDSVVGQGTRITLEMPMAKAAVEPA